jgi:hypothetical protein
MKFNVYQTPEQVSAEDAQENRKVDFSEPKT